MNTVIAIKLTNNNLLLVSCIAISGRNLIRHSHSNTAIINGSHQLINTYSDFLITRFIFNRKLTYGVKEGLIYAHKGEMWQYFQALDLSSIFDILKIIFLNILIINLIVGSL